MMDRAKNPRERARARVTAARQKLARRLDPVGHELLYQASYLDLARRTSWLQDVPLSSPGGGTASFSQLYLLLRILNEGAGISRVLELGVGISTSIITQWVEAHDGTSVHVDDDAGWLEATVPAGDRVSALHAPLGSRTIGDRQIEWYDVAMPEGGFDLLLVDGPQAWNAANRFNRLGVLDWTPDVLAEEFVVVIDDSARPGEHRLAGEMERVIRASGRSVHRRDVVGANSQTLLVSDAYRFAAYL
ncbi:MAG: hypothetical protein WC558_06980 [Patulibacter sp.]